MSHGQSIKLSDPLRPHYNRVALHNEDNPVLKFDLSDRPSYKDSGYRLTIYKKSDRATIASYSIDSDAMSVTVPDYSFGSQRAVVVVEDRSTPGKIDAIETIGYIYFHQFKGTTDLTLLGHIEYTNNDGSVILIPYYETGFIIT